MNSGSQNSSRNFYDADWSQGQSQSDPSQQWMFQSQQLLSQSQWPPSSQLGPSQSQSQFAPLSQHGPSLSQWPPLSQQGPSQSHGPPLSQPWSGQQWPQGQSQLLTVHQYDESMFQSQSLPGQSQLLTPQSQYEEDPFQSQQLPGPGVPASHSQMLTAYSQSQSNFTLLLNPGHLTASTGSSFDSHSNSSFGGQSQYWSQQTYDTQLHSSVTHQQLFSQPSSSSTPVSNFSQSQSLPSTASSLPLSHSDSQVQISQSQRQNQNRNAVKDQIIGRIEDEIMKMVTAYSEKRLPVFHETTVSSSGGVRESAIDFGKENSRKKFTVLTVIMSTTHRLLLTQKTLTHRDLFYENVSLFENQRTVDFGIRSVARILKVKVESLPFEPSAKGLMAGGEKMELKRVVSEKQMETVVVSNFETLVPSVSVLRGWGKFESNAKFILIVEKDAIFKRLVDDKIFEMFEPFILVTGKGFSDRATRAFVHKLSVDLGIPSFALVDGDAYGLSIAVNYKYGSKHVDLTIDEDDTLPNLITIGVLPSEFSKLAMKAESKMPFAGRDKSTLDSLAKRLTKLNDQQLLKEVDTLKALQYKVEIEAVAALGHKFLLNYLKTKIREHLIV